MSKVGVCIVGLNGGVSTTSISAAKAITKGITPNWGIYSETMMSTVTKEGKLDRKNQKPIKDVLNLVKFDDLVFAGWDIEDGDCYQYAEELNIYSYKIRDQIKDELKKIKPWRGAFSKQWVRNLDGHYVLSGSSMEKAEAIRKNIRDFKEENDLQNVVVMNVSSTEVYKQPSAVHLTVDAFEKGLNENDPNISPGMIYCYAALKEGAAWSNFTPAIIEEIPALRTLADENKSPIGGKDGKTGQTLMKTVLAPIFYWKNLNVDGWFSTNILGNKDGFVLDDPGSFESKRVTKSSVLDSILTQKDPVFHTVKINYYPPRGDDKEAWDNIDFRGILGEKMQIKIDFLCKDSILAAGNVLDLIRFLEYAKRKGDYGIQEQLSMFYKGPLVRNGGKPIHSFPKQEGMMKDYLREKAFGVKYKS